MYNGKVKHGVSLMIKNIAKLYELALGYKCNMPDIDCNHNCSKCEDYIPNKFTPEKQLELIKWLQLSDNLDNLLMFYHDINNRWCLIVEMLPESSNIPTERLHCSHEEFEQALASLITNLWNDLTDEQRNEIKEILK